MTRQAEVLQRAVEASGEVRSLEDALNRNLATLAGAKHFEQTVHGAGRDHPPAQRPAVGKPRRTKPSIQLEPGRRAAHAA